MTAHSLQDSLIRRLAWFDLSASQGALFTERFVEIAYALCQQRQTILLEK